MFGLGQACQAVRQVPATGLPTICAHVTFTVERKKGRNCAQNTASKLAGYPPGHFKCVTAGVCPRLRQHQSQSLLASVSRH